MDIIHIGLPVSSEENADCFFVNILGLEKSVPKILDQNLTQSIFGINNEMTIIHYLDSNIDFEILVYNNYKPSGKQIVHSCIKVTGLKNIVNKCKAANLKVIEVPKGSTILTFISDYDGNLFELKE